MQRDTTSQPSIAGCASNPAPFAAALEPAEPFDTIAGFDAADRCDVGAPEVT